MDFGGVISDSLICVHGDKSFLFTGCHVFAVMSIVGPRNFLVSLVASMLISFLFLICIVGSIHAMDVVADRSGVAPYLMASSNENRGIVFDKVLNNNP